MKRFFLLIAVLPSAHGHLHGAILFTNVGGVPGSVDVQLSQTTHLAATEFTTGPGASIITEVHLHVDNGDSIDHNYTTSLYSDAGGIPGTLITTFTPAGVSPGLLPAGNAALMEFSHAGLNVTANTTYWLTLGIQENTTSGSYTGINIKLTDTTDGVSGFANSTPPGSYFSSNSGASWSSASASNGMFMIVGTMVPEPGRAVLLMAGMAAVALRRRRRQGYAGIS